MVNVVLNDVEFIVVHYIVYSFQRLAWASMARSQQLSAGYAQPVSQPSAMAIRYDSTRMPWPCVASNSGAACVGHEAQ